MAARHRVDQAAQLRPDLLIAPDYVLADRKIVAELTDKIVATIAEFRATGRIRRCGSSASGSSTGWSR